MTEKTNKRIVQVFPKPDWITSPSCCGPNSCNCGPTEGLEEVLAMFSLKHGDRAEVHIADCSTDSAMSKVIDDLNRVLEASQEEFRVKKENFELFMGQTAPIIAIDWILAFYKGVPSEEQLARALKIVPTPTA